MSQLLESAIHDSGKFRKKSVGRLTFVAFIVFGVFLIYAIQLFKIQAVDASELAQEGFEARIREVVVPAMRGSITDVNGIALATTVPAFNVTADQTKVIKPKETAKLLAPILKLDSSELASKLVGEKKFTFVARAVTPQVWAAVAELELPGIFSEKTTRRVYPYGDLAGNILGFTGIDGHGLEGLESSLESQLGGKDGLMIFEGGAAGRKIPATDSRTEQAVSGNGARLSIDRDLQYIAQQAIAQKVKEANAAWGTVVVLEPSTGRVLAMATAPTVNPADPGAINKDSRKNVAVTDVFEPGSTGKLLTFAAALEEKVITPLSKLTIPPPMGCWLNHRILEQS